MFKFRLQRVLEMRQQSEQDAASALAEARSAEEAALMERLRLEAARDEGMAQAVGSAASQPKVGQLQNLRFLVERLNDEIEAAQLEVEAAAAQVQEKLEVYSGAFRDRHMLDKLRQKALETHRSDEVQADRKAMDGIALARYLRNRGAAPAKES
jgi:flagellar export protein FliJ